MDVLITCPPLIGVLAEFERHFAERGLKPTAPPVVQALSENQLVELVPNFEGWILGDDPATLRVFEAGRRGRLRAAVKWGVGVDNVDFPSAARLGVPVANTPGMFGDEVADVAMAYITGLARETYRIDREVRAGAWPKPRGVSLAGKTAGLAGFGDIGRSIARRLIAAKMRVLVYDPAYRAVPDLDSVAHRPWPVDIDAADFLILACALTLENRHMISRSLLAQTRPGLRIVNVARGGLIDEAALVDGLASGRVHSAALDVFETEPLPDDSPLRRFERCVLGSHNSSNTREAVQRASERAIDMLHGLLQQPRP